MRYAEIEEGIRVTISNDEADFMDHFLDVDQLFKADLTDNECVIANKLVHKSVIKRRKSDGQLYFIKCRPTKIQSEPYHSRQN